MGVHEPRAVYNEPATDCSETDQARRPGFTLNEKSRGGLGLTSSHSALERLSGAPSYIDILLSPAQPRRWCDLDLLIMPWILGRSMDDVVAPTEERQVHEQSTWSVD